MDILAFVLLEKEIGSNGIVVYIIGVQWNILFNLQNAYIFAGPRPISTTRITNPFKSL